MKDDAGTKKPEGRQPKPFSGKNQLKQIPQYREEIESGRQQRENKAHRIQPLSSPKERHDRNAVDTFEFLVV